ncbi:MAG: hypothetical protein ACOX6Y_02760 [Christensenellales bacterium]|jgi:hypothetical protein
MKKTLVILVMALLIALPVFGLAAETATPAQYGPRWRQNAPTVPTTPAVNPAAPKTNYVDADNDGICDNCGLAQGKNPNAPGFTDENGDGVCDHLGTTMQRRFAAGSRQMMGARGGMHKRSSGSTQRNARSGRGVQGAAQRQNYVDADNDGVCDNLSAAPMTQNRQRPGQGAFGPAQRNVRPGRNRR